MGKKKLFFQKGLTGIDFDCKNFIDATGITDESVKNAVCQLVTNLKNYGLWDKTQVIYPFASDGINKTRATQHTFNLKDPRDADDAFRLSYNSAVVWEHTNLGANPNSNYATTFFSPLIYQDVNSNGLTVAFNSSTSTSSYAMGSADGDAKSSILSRTTLCGGFLNNGQITANAGDGTAMGVVTLSRQNATTTVLFKNSVKLKTVNSGGFLPSVNIQVSGFAGSGNTKEDKRFCFAAIHKGLTDLDIINFNTTIEIYNTSLGRKLW